MSSTSANNNKRIAKNTIILYFRMIFLMLISLYTSRVILDALGVTDYGIYNVVGGFVAVFSLISSSLANACSRFLNYEMGKGDLERQKVVFSTTLLIQWIIALAVAILAEVVGVWYINNIMVLPVERIEAANWCFQFSVLNFCMNLITVPYNASIVAHEKMKAFAYISIYQGLAILGISFLIFISPIDKLVFYAFLLLVVQLSVRITYQIYCRRNFEECQYKRCLDKPLLKHILSYSLWHMMGNGAAILKVHGINIVLNLFFGPVVNAARGIANQVDSAVNVFVANFMMAMNPQITQSYANGNFKYMFGLIDKGSRFSFYLLLFLSLPLILNMDFILHIWLKEVPDHTTLFAQLTLVSMSVTSISRTLMTAQNATGNVRDYQLIVGGILLFNLPISYICLLLGMMPEIVVIVSISLEIVALVVRLYILPQTVIGFKPLLFVRNVVARCGLVAIFASVVPFVIRKLLPDDFISLVLSIIISFLCSSIVIYYVGCNGNEKIVIREYINKMCKRFIN